MNWEHLCYSLSKHFIISITIFNSWTIFDNFNNGIRCYLQSEDRVLTLQSACNSVLCGSSSHGPPVSKGLSAFHTPIEAYIPSGLPKRTALVQKLLGMHATCPAHLSFLAFIFCSWPMAQTTSVSPYVPIQSHPSLMIFVLL